MMMLDIARSPDVLVRDAGTTFVLTALSLAAKTWMEQNLSIEPWQRYGEAIVIERQCMLGVAQGLRDAGFLINFGELP